MMLKLLFHLAVFFTYLVSADEDTDAEIDRLARIREYDITGLHKSENLLACLESYNCKPHRLDESTWRTELIGNVANIPDMTLEKRQCGPNQHGVTKTIVTLGQPVLGYGSIMPYDMVQATESLCGGGGCNSNANVPFQTASITENDTDYTNFTIIATPSGVYPSTEFRDAMINTAAIAINATATTAWFNWQSCRVIFDAGYCHGGVLSQITAIDYVQVDVYGTDHTVNMYLIATYSVSINHVVPPGNRDYLGCQTLLGEVATVASIINPWLYLLAA